MIVIEHDCSRANMGSLKHNYDHCAMHHYDHDHVEGQRGDLLCTIMIIEQ